MCPNCRAFISTSDRVCPYCETQLGPRAVDLRFSPSSSAFLPRANQSAIILLALNCAFFLIELIVNAKLGGSPSNISMGTLYILGCKVTGEILAGQWWRLITAGFLHGGFLHIAMNSYALIILVTEAEQFFGTSRLIVAYILSTVGGFYLSAVQSPGVPSVGASAAAFGLIGLMLSLGVRHRSDPLALAIRAQYTQWLIFSLVLGVFSRGIDIWAHVGGGIVGFLFGLIAGLPRLPGSPREQAWKVAAIAVTLLTAAAFWLDFLAFRMYLHRI